MLNLHSLICPLINSVHPEEEVIVYRCLGQRNIKGEIKTVYATGEKMRARVQSEKDSGLHFSDAQGFNFKFRKIYLLARPLDRKISALDPLTENGGDLIQLSDKSWWLCVEVLEDFANVGWMSVRVTAQNVPNDYTPEMEK